MRKILYLLLFLPFITFSQVAKDYAVLLTAEVKENPPSIAISWPAESASSYFIYKKLKSQSNFGSAFEVLSGTSTTYVDTNVEVGKSYEYQVKRNGSVAAYGYINSGIKCDADLNDLAVKGKIILLVDSGQALALVNEIGLLTSDLEGEGWTVLRHYIAASLTPPLVKQIIYTEYQKDPANVKALLLIGHIAVPYSGNLAPDGHPDHVGAWPADSYYGELNSNWTDNVINTVSASDPRNQNIPGDGKFDFSILPSDVELQVGRVDFYDMPAFSSTETELLRNYLQKNHAFRTKGIQIVPRALIDDNFGGFSGEAFAASGWKAFSTFFGPDSIHSNIGSSLDYIADLGNRSYLWSYGCGGGSYTSAGGIGTTSQLAADSLQTVFTALFGSYFGDWDKTNNFLRAPLAQGITLTNAWSGRPHWYFHHMALGENIGYSQRLTANNSSVYYMHYAARFIHIALMGDPTLRMYVVSPPSNLQLAENGNAVDLNWTASNDNVLGYHIYRKDSLKGLYHRINDDIVTVTNYTDEEFDFNGDYYYSVRAVKLEVTPSGSFYNLSTGAVGGIQGKYLSASKYKSKSNVRLFPNPNNGNFILELSGFAGRVSLTLSDVEGRTIRNEWVYIDQNMFRKSLVYPNLQPSVYFLNIQDGQSSQTLKILVN